MFSRVFTERIVSPGLLSDARIPLEIVLYRGEDLLSTLIVTDVNRDSNAGAIFRRHEVRKRIFEHALRNVMSSLHTTPCNMSVRKLMIARLVNIGTPNALHYFEAGAIALRSSE